MIETWKLPPRFKILHALGIIADEKIKWVSNAMAEIDGFKVFYDSSKNSLHSEDKGSKERSYIGYPALAILMFKGIIPFNKKISNALKNFNWSVYDYNSFSKGEVDVKKVLEIKGISTDKVDDYLDRVYDGIRKNGFQMHKNKEQSLFRFS